MGSANFPKTPVSHRLQLLVSGDRTTILQIHQKARIFAGRVNSPTQITHLIAGKGYLLVAEGEVSVNDILAQKGDGITISKEASVILTTKADTELLIIEVPSLEEAR